MAAVLLLAAHCAAPLAAAAEYPTRPVRLVVPFAPGGSSDIVGRLTAQKLSELWGQPVVIDNRGGAGGVVGAETAARSAPDGYTILFANQGPLVHNVLLRRNPSYTVKDFAPIIYVGHTNNIIVAHPKFPASNVKELVAYAKANPGRINWASTGTNSNPHIALEQLKMAAGIDIVHVPYKGAGPALTDLIGGQVHAQYASFASSEPHLRAGRLKVLGASGTKRHPALPDVATLPEQGIKGADSILWFGYVAPARTPRPLVEKLNAGFNQVLQAPDVRARLAQLGIEIEGGAPEKFSAVIRKEAALLAPLIQAGALKVE
jgi:tripartite-type tricarboxylate transporter receptor subunit TctC